MIALFIVVMLYLPTHIVIGEALKTPCAECAVQR